jgi:F0F1-type ATP synthase membrane subunit b/b'
MESRIARTSLALGVVFWPAAALAAETEQAQGSWFALIFYVINFLLFILIVRRYGGPLITKYFGDHARTIRDIRERAEKAYLEAQELASRAAERLQQLEAEKHQMQAELDEETTYQIGQISEAARDAVSRIRRDAELGSAALRDGAQRRLRQTMAEAAGRIARELLKRNFQAPDQARLLRGFVDRIAEETRS